jgi:hypothetical protein
MLDFLVVLGRVPGTNIVITFNEIFIVFLILSARYEYKLHRRWLYWAWGRICVNYRKQKRHAKAVIRYKRYRLAVFERRIKRNVRFAIKRRRRAVYAFFYRRYSNLRRYYYRKVIEIERLERRLKRRLAFVGWDN